jgi:hypothetical protein
VTEWFSPPVCVAILVSLIGTDPIGDPAEELRKKGTPNGFDISTLPVQYLSISQKTVKPIK